MVTKIILIMSDSETLKQELIDTVVEKTGESIRPILTLYVDLLITSIKIEVKAKIADVVLKTEI